jgi:hypothetical protein
MCLSRGDEKLMTMIAQKLRFYCQTRGFKRMSVQHERKFLLTHLLYLHTDMPQKISLPAIVSNITTNSQHL